MAFPKLLPETFYSLILEKGVYYNRKLMIGREQKRSVSFDKFFGKDQGLFQIIVAIVAFATAIYTFYKSFVERAKLFLYPGDRLGLIVSAGGGCWKFHLRGSLVNHAVKTGTLHRLEAEIKTPTGNTHLYLWDIFFEYISGTLNVQPAGDATPISIPGKNSQPLYIQFRLATMAALTPVLTQAFPFLTQAASASAVAGPAPANLQIPLPQWLPGRYEVKISGWVNKANRGESSNLSMVFHFSLDAVQSQLLAETPGQPNVINVPIEEWEAST
jgi:hypothetical protein